MKSIRNESTLRYLRKQHRDWSKEQINLEAERIWQNYVLINKEKLEEEAKKDLERWNECLDREFRRCWLDSFHN